MSDRAGKPRPSAAPDSSPARGRPGAFASLQTLLQWRERRHWQAKQLVLFMSIASQFVNLTIYIYSVVVEHVNLTRVKRYLNFCVDLKNSF